MQKILIIAPSWVGDMVMAQSLFIALKENNPNCQIDVLAPAWSLGLLARMPEVSQTFVIPLTHGEFNVKARFLLGRKLRVEKYDQAIVLPNSWKSALIPFFANIPKRTGFLGEARFGLLNDARKLDKSVLTMTVQRFVALAESTSPLPPFKGGMCFKFPLLNVIELQQKTVIDKFNLRLSQPILVLCAGAEYGSAKRWTETHFAELASQKIAEGWQIWLIGSEKDKFVTEEINKLTGWQCQDFTGKTDLTEAVDLLSLAHTVVSNDSGLMHVAAALNKKVVAIYGSSDPKFTPPLHADAKIVTLNLPCSPCFKRDCPLQHRRCLTDILPTQISGLIHL
ncbi:MAG: lipopolysaccharide heptosyltransferase II [Methylococcales bacterium]|nr:lipopolysaccharide heptosyltransferase II [Methylococcales bacterium]MDD5753251.1 lipopolysaccharide heptosyltransferase II [Methylococcales bacterium]